MRIGLAAGAYIAAVILTPAAAQAQTPVAGLAAAAAPDTTIVALGRIADTLPAGARGYGVLILDDWTIEKNHDWILGVAARRLSTRTVSSPAPAQLWDAESARPTVYAQELAQLAALGYQRTGRWLIPPSARQRQGVAADAARAFAALPATVPAGADPALWLATTLGNAFGDRPDAAQAWPALRADLWGATARESLEQMDDLLSPAPTDGVGTATGRPHAGATALSVAARQREDEGSRGWRSERAAARVEAGWRAGRWRFTAGAAAGRLDVRSDGSAPLRARGHASHLLARATRPFGAWRLTLGAGWSQVRWDGARHLRIASAGNDAATALTAAATPRAHVFAGTARAGWGAHRGRLRLHTGTTLRLARAGVGAFRESGADELTLAVAPLAVNAAAAGVDARLAWRHWIAPHLHAAWRHDVVRPSPRPIAEFVDTPGARLPDRTARAGRGRLAIEAGLSIAPPRVRRLRLHAIAAIAHAGRYTTHQLSAGGGWRF